MSLNIKNHNLYDKMKTVVDKAMVVMQPELQQAWNIRSKILRTNKPFLFTLLSPSKPDFQRLINRYKHYGIEKLPEFKECENLLRNDTEISKYIHRYVGTQRGTDKQFTWSSRYIYYILEQLVGRYFYTQEYDTKLFDSLYYDFEKMCYDGYIPVRDLAPLHNFDVSDIASGRSMDELLVEGLDLFAFEPINLEKNLRIKKITKDENKILFELQRSEYLSMFEVGEPSFAIECDVDEPIITYKQPNDPQSQKYQSEDYIDALLTALRLFKSDFVGYSSIFPFKDLNVFVELKRKAKHVISEKQFGKLYSVSKIELLNFQSFWRENGNVLMNSFADNGRWNELGNCITYFNSSYDRTNDRDKIIDLFVSAEALFVTRGLSDPQTKIVSNRMSVLLGKTESEQKKICKDMKDLAEERGKAAHGSRRMKYNYKSLEEYMRRSINEYLYRIKNDCTMTHERLVNPTFNQSTNVT
jgi:hypothetical protein